MANRKVELLANGMEIARRAAGDVLRIAREAAAARGMFTIALSGGSTPKVLYALLAEHPSLRNSDAMLSKAPLRAEQIHRIKGEYPDTAQAAGEYEVTIQREFGLKGGEFPRFDLVLLGMGSEGHTLSLFPGTKALHETQRIVTRNWVGKLYTERVTLTAPAANNAASIIFMIAGADKACALKAVLEGPHEPEQLPAQMIQPSNGTLSWLVDQAAGSMLSKEILT